MQLNAVLSGNTPVNWAQKCSFPKVHFRSSKLKRMAAVRCQRHHHQKQPLWGSRVASRLVPDRAGRRKFLLQCMCFLGFYFFFFPAFPPPSWWRGKEEAGVTDCILVPEALTAVLSGGKGALWGTSGAPGNLEWGQP